MAGKWFSDDDFHWHKNASGDIIDKAAHTWETVTSAGKTLECSVCGHKKVIYEEMDGKILFGEYPQTKETNDKIVAELTRLSGDRPVKGNAGKWTDYKYYINGEIDEYMWYTDIEYQGTKYRGVYFTSLRPNYTIEDVQVGQQDKNGYNVDTLYWFKWEPIEWRVLEMMDGEAFLMSNTILDSQQYFNNMDNRDMDGATVYPNNYKESDIRAWLNKDFYNWAFDDAEQSIISITNVDNSQTAIQGSNKYACENTNDKVFLLSFKEAISEKYGQNSLDKLALKATDYAKVQGIVLRKDEGYEEYGSWWWTRSPYDGGEVAFLMFQGGMASYGSFYVFQTSRGVVPAIKITL